MVNLPQFVEERKKLFLSISVALVLLLPTIWFGLGHVIAKQALTVPHGCGLWEYSSDYESRIVTFFIDSLEFKS